GQVALHRGGFLGPVVPRRVVGPRPPPPGGGGDGIPAGFPAARPRRPDWRHGRRPPRPPPAPPPRARLGGRGPLRRGRLRVLGLGGQRRARRRGPGRHRRVAVAARRRAPRLRPAGRVVGPALDRGRDRRARQPQLRPQRRRPVLL